MRNAYRLREIGHMSDQSEDKILKLKKTHPLWRSEDSFEHVRQRKNIWFNILFHKKHWDLIYYKVSVIKQQISESVIIYPHVIEYKRIILRTMKINEVCMIMSDLSEMSLNFELLWDSTKTFMRFMWSTQMGCPWLLVWRHMGSRACVILVATIFPYPPLPSSYQ